MKFAEYIFEPHNVEGSLPEVYPTSVELLEDISDDGSLPFYLETEAELMKKQQPRLWKAARNLAAITTLKIFQSLKEDGDPMMSMAQDGFELPRALAVADYRKQILGAVRHGFIIGNTVAFKQYELASMLSMPRRDISEDTAKSFATAPAIDNTSAAVTIRTERYVRRLNDLIDYGLDIEFPDEYTQEATRLGALVAYTLMTFENNSRIRDHQMTTDFEDRQFELEERREQEYALLAAAFGLRRDRTQADTLDRIHAERRQDLERLYAQPSYVRHHRSIRDLFRHRRK